MRGYNIFGSTDCAISSICRKYNNRRNTRFQGSMLYNEIKNLQFLLILRLALINFVSGVSILLNIVPGRWSIECLACVLRRWKVLLGLILQYPRQYICLQPAIFKNHKHDITILRLILWCKSNRHHLQGINFISQ